MYRELLYVYATVSKRASKQADAAGKWPREELYTGPVKTRKRELRFCTGESVQQKTRAWLGCARGGATGDWPVGGEKATARAGEKAEKGV